MSEILTEAVERIDSEANEDTWLKTWSNGDSWEKTWENR